MKRSFGVAFNPTTKILVLSLSCSPFSPHSTLWPPSSSCQTVVQASVVMNRQMNGKQVEEDKGWIEGRRRGRGVTHIAEPRVFIEKCPNWQELHWYPATCPSTPFLSLVSCLSLSPAIFQLAGTTQFPVFFLDIISLPSALTPQFKG